ncbi:hypothetical protein JTB14_027266 [Gonioctena quinquepunctata]|nr:hypothetical protein JTB14_027266 [Gonioctena quinquepunctata]
MKFVLIICFIIFIKLITAYDARERAKASSPCKKLDQYFLVSIRNKRGKHVCLGTLLNKDWVVTAARCDLIEGFVSTEVGKRAGSAMHVSIPVDKIKVHPKFNRSGYDNDIALYHLASPINEDEHIKYVKLPTEENPEDIPCPHTVVMVLDVTNITPKVESSTLQCFPLSFITNKLCVDMYEPSSLITTNMLCTISMNKRDACKGDLGAPLMCGDTQHGFVSTREKCSTGVPGVNMRVDKYLDFIRLAFKKPDIRREEPRAASSAMLKTSFSFVFLIFCCNLMIQK